MNNNESDLQVKPLEEYFSLKPTSIMKDEELPFSTRINEIEEIA